MWNWIASLEPQSRAESAAYSAFRTQERSEVLRGSGGGVYDCVCERREVSSTTHIDATALE